MENSPLSETDEGDRSAVDTPDDDDSSDESESALVECVCVIELSDSLESLGASLSWFNRRCR